MTYRLDEIKDFLIDENGYFQEDMADELYDLFCSEWTSSSVLVIPEFTLNNIKYAAKTFNFSRKSKKVLDDYCEGKTEYHYDIKLLDNNSGEQYQIVTSYFNDDRTNIDLSYLVPKNNKKEKSVIACCDSMKLVSITGKCSDTFAYKEKKDTQWKESSPSELNLGSSDYIEFTYCKTCSKIHFK